MTDHFDLSITADTANACAEFDLRDSNGTQLAYHATEFKDIAASDQYGLFDLRTYLRHYATSEADETTRIAHIGLCIAEQVLGAEIFKHLYQSEAQRTLRIQLPGADDEVNTLAALLARVPWEIARPSTDKATLGERNLLVRVVHDMAESATKPLDSPPGETLRVLFVFAETRGSRPLAARKERRALLELFTKEIYPDRRIEAYFLTHGVTRERLHDQIQENNGYHIVHWSGHGHLNLLELAKPGGGSDHLSGQELLDLFTDAGGFLPRLFFLSACHSGDILRVKDWNDFASIAAGRNDRTANVSEGARGEAANTKDIQLDEQPGYTGTAHALLQGGVPSVIAMRYAVGDEYARDLAVEFYRKLLADKQPKHAAAALTMARKELLKQHNARYADCDHATPVLYGAAQPDLRWPKGRSPALDDLNRERRLPQIAELTEAQHEYFVGRTWELTGLGTDFIGSDQQPVAVIIGLGGMGKTALTAETLALWESRFEWVLLYQAKPNALNFETFLRDVDLKLRGELGRYHDHVKARPADAIYRDAGEGFSGAERYDRLTRNLIRALRDEAILLVLDNFETNLKPHPEGETEGQRDGETDSSATPLSVSPSLPLSVSPLWACQDANWDHYLARLAEELKGTRSRVLVTCRQPLAALRGKGYAPVPLGPLPAGEAALYLRDHAALSRMFFSDDASERALAMRLLNASRFHPLLMDRLARLAAGGEKLRAQLLEALDTLEQGKGFAQLPALFATRPGDAKEMAYLNDALATSLDQLIAHASPDARRLLWMIAVANEPVETTLLQDVAQSFSKELPTQTKPDNFFTESLNSLINLGLVVRNDESALSCHELVKERMRINAIVKYEELANLDKNAIQLSFANCLIAKFYELNGQNTLAALKAGSRALVYCSQAQAHNELEQVASYVITSINNPQFLKYLLPHLFYAAESAQTAHHRKRCLGLIADAMYQSGFVKESLPFYESAAHIAISEINSISASQENKRQAWADASVFFGNGAQAFRELGALDIARKWQLESLNATKCAGFPQIFITARELELLRLDTLEGNTEQALPEINSKLQLMKNWWQQFQASKPTLDANDAEFLARAYIAALDIAKFAHKSQRDWNAALSRIDSKLEIKRTLNRPPEDVAGDKLNRADILVNLGRFAEAQVELEACLQVYQNDPVNSSKVFSTLANLLDEKGDVTAAVYQQRRALALREHLPNIRDRIVSHACLAIYLDKFGTPKEQKEASQHKVADLIYCLVSNLGQDLQTSLDNYFFYFRRAHEAGTPLVVPRVADLLADSAFRPLDDWLRQRQVDVDELQAAIDQLLEQVSEAALAEHP